MSQIDPFDFNTYSFFYELLNRYYTGCELYFRTAVLVENMINNDNNPWSVKDNPSRPIEELYAPMLDATSSELKQFITQSTQVFCKKQNLVKFYIHLGIPHRDISALLHKYKGFHSELFNRAYKKHIDPAHITQILWIK
jgi:hypothetical protein